MYSRTKDDVAIRTKDDVAIHKAAFGIVKEVDVIESKNQKPIVLPLSEDGTMIPRYFEDVEAAFDAAKALHVFDVYVLTRAWTHLDGEWMVAYRHWDSLREYAVGDTVAEAIAEACLKIARGNEHAGRREDRQDAEKRK